MNRQEAAQTLHEFMQEACVTMGNSLPSGQFYDQMVADAEELTATFGRWVKTEYWTPEHCTMLNNVLNFCKRELELLTFDEDPPQWFLDVSYALQITKERLEEGQHYFD